MLPSLVNTHHHLYQTLTRAVPAAQNAETGLWYQVLDQGTREGNYLEASQGCSVLRVGHSASSHPAFCAGDALGERAPAAPFSKLRARLRACPERPSEAGASEGVTITEN